MPRKKSKAIGNLPTAWLQSVICLLQAVDSPDLILRLTTLPTTLLPKQILQHPELVVILLVGECDLFAIWTDTQMIKIVQSDFRPVGFTPFGRDTADRPRSQRCWDNEIQ